MGSDHLEAMERARSRSPLRAGGLACWLAPNEKQVNDLTGDGAEPDAYPQRFQAPKKALKRELNLKTFTLCKVTIPASGYMHLTEKGRLETRKKEVFMEA